MRAVLALLGLLLIACGSASTTGAQADGGTCAQPAPDLQCPTCGNGTVPPVCKDGAWACGPTPPCIALPEDAGADATPLPDGSLLTPPLPDAASDAPADASASCPACDFASHYCEISYGPPQSDGGSSVTDSCLSLPACDAAPSCACVTFGPFCTCVDDGGDITVTCPFHV